MSLESNETISDYADRLREVITHLDNGETERADSLLDEIARQRDTSLFRELGKLTREFHEALQSFRTDSRLAAFTDGEFSDARERLKYVISMTDQAADRSLSAAESTMPITANLKQQASELSESWTKFNRRELSADEFRQLNRQLITFLGLIVEQMPQIESNLTEVVMAQDFQDLTGQIITKVITLVDDVEESLVDLIRISGEKMLDKQEHNPRRHDRSYEAQGALVPGVDDTGVEVVSGQDEVDDLLSSLGF
ncbi:protein phosphatase CheZ [Ectothiorhodospiraceae bacterium BW-2]|nr:protein phosphatase CheZ [Ectothiorhodospiraceae bacterium BW-2]